MGAQAVARVGISGWRYPPWRGHFYPKGLPQRRELEYAAERLDTIEINGTFYSLQRPESFAAWRDQTPDDFVFAVKGGRFITHILRLRDTQQALANFFASGVLALGPKLGPILWQLPQRLSFDAALVESFLASLPQSTAEAVALATQHDARVGGRAWAQTDADRAIRHAFEVRSGTFGTPHYFALLRRFNVASVIADTAGTWPEFVEDTAEFRYLRLHGMGELYAGGYDAHALDVWATRIRGWRDAGQDCYTYFDNDAKVRAPFDAMALADRLR